MKQLSSVSVVAVAGTAVLAAWGCAEPVLDPYPTVADGSWPTRMVADAANCVKNNVEQGGTEVCVLPPIDVVVCRFEGAAKDDDGECRCPEGQVENEDSKSCEKEDDDGEDEDGNDGEDDDGDEDDNDDGGEDAGNGGGENDDGEGEEDDEDEDGLEEEGARDVKFNLSCPSTERGAVGTCTVSTEDTLVDLTKLSFDWSSNIGPSPGASRKGAGAEWSGTATSDAAVEVTVSGPGIQVKKLAATILLRARTWRVSATVTGSSQPGVEYSAASTYWGNAGWGLHTLPRNPTPPVAAAGSGPWTGEYYAEGPPEGGRVGNRLWIHPDFVAKGPTYPGANSTCSPASSLPSSSGVRTVNDTCGNKTNLDAWKNMVVAHEQVHADTWPTA